MKYMLEKYGAGKYRKIIGEVFKVRAKYGKFNNVSEEYSKIKKSKNKKVILCTLPGRSGTRWLADIFEAHPGHVSYIERFTDQEAFYRFVNYNKLPVDTQGIVELLKKGILQDWETHDTVFIGSPYFSHGLINLATELEADDLVFAFSDPKFTVISMYNKGLFNNKYIKRDHNKATGYQPEMNLKWNHVWGRLTPFGKEYTRWDKLTQIGKCSWFWNMICNDVQDQINSSKYKNNIFYFKLEEADQNYDYYLNLAKRFNLSPILDKETFLNLKGKTVTKKQNTPKKFTKKENEEFLNETKSFRKIYPTLKNKIS